jgi:hypothetical protein
MARYEHLPIYKQALDVAVHFERIVAGFSRYHKYTLGSVERFYPGMSQFGSKQSLRIG